jgi:hypothetical protein
VPRLRHPSSGVVVNVSDGTAARLGWPPAVGSTAGPAKPPPADAPPPKVGKGSSRAAWADYASLWGVEVTDDMTRADIIAAVEG